METHGGLPTLLAPKGVRAMDVAACALGLLNALHAVGVNVGAGNMEGECICTRARAGQERGLGNNRLSQNVLLLLFISFPF